MRLFQLDYTVLVVEDLDRAVAFYTDVLGISLSHRTGGYAQLVTGPTRLALYTREAMAATLGRPIEPPPAPAHAAEGDAPLRDRFEIGFLVADVDAAFAEIVAAGAAPVKEPTDRFWGQRTAYVRDPDGHLIELAQPLGD
ncbi:MAG: VOC family protein [Myxococcales bacterium]|nr:VOC family protein [Myxococcales bacterium]